MAERGRPRSFDKAVVLKRAMEVFWERGYEGASLTDLTTAMGINSPSLYAAFGSKEALFREAVEHYGATEGVVTARALDDAPTVRDAIRELMCAAIRAYSLPGRPHGCMIVTAGVNVGDEHANVRRHMMECRREAVERIKARLDRGVREGELAPGTDTDSLAIFYSTVLNGLSLLARDGASHERLKQVVDCTLAAWDSLTSPETPPAPAA